MKILIGSNIHWWNAEAEYAAKIAHLLHQAGHKVFILTRPDSLNAQKLAKLGLPLVENINLNSKNPLEIFLSYKKMFRIGNWGNLVEQHLLKFLANNLEPEQLLRVAEIISRNPEMIDEDTFLEIINEFTPETWKNKLF